jgi:hypothetical protein
LRRDQLVVTKGTRLQLEEVSPLLLGLWGKDLDNFNAVEMEVGFDLDHIPDLGSAVK